MKRKKNFDKNFRYKDNQVSMPSMPKALNEYFNQLKQRLVLTGVYTTERLQPRAAGKSASAAGSSGASESSPSSIPSPTHQ